MGRVVDIRVPDLGDSAKVDVVEVLISAGDRVELEQGLITLESDKASMEIPSPHAGTVRKVKVSVGDKVTMDDLIAVLEIDERAEAEAKAKASAPKPAAPESVTGPPADYHAEVLVLGSGPGGYTAAFRAADLGKKVVLVERYSTLGGVCLNVGCIPSKALLHAGKVLDEAAAFAEHGIRFGEPEINVEDLRTWKEGVVARLTGGIATLAKQRKVEVVEGTGRFTSPRELLVTTADGPKRIAFEYAIVAVGSQPMMIPGLPAGDPRVMDSTSALEMKKLPKRLLVVGGGIIGLEMATVYHAMGSLVTVVELLDGLIPGCDRDIVRPLHKRLAERYENIYLETKVTRVEALKKGLRVHFEGKDAPDSDLFERVLVAVGRRPNGHEIGAEAAGVTVDERGFIPVDRQLRTHVSHILAIGDVVGQPMLAHKAAHEGRVAAEVISGMRSSFDARVIPSVAYTDPEIAWVGLTETEAKAKGVAYGVGSFPWSASGRSLSMGRSEGKTKLLFDEESDRVLGAGIVGQSAGDLISEVALAIEMGCTAGDIGLTVHPHPTLSETVAFSAEAFAGTLTDLYLPKRR